MTDAELKKALEVRVNELTIIIAALMAQKTYSRAPETKTVIDLELEKLENRKSIYYRAVTELV